MKIFAIYTNLLIVDDPEWLDSFRKKYDVPYDIHITLIQPRFVKDEDILEIKKSVASYFKKLSANAIDLIFNEYHLDRQDITEDGCIMISSSERETLSAIQKDLLQILKKYQDYYEEKTKDYEKDFVPHITIGRHLGKDMYDEALPLLPKKIMIKAMVTEMVLAVVADKSAAERKDPNNLTVYKLT